MGQDRSILTGAACALLGVFPLAALVALCYRFPVPFDGYEGGLKAVPLSLFAVMFFGLTGVGIPFSGFVVLAGIGGAAGAAAHLLTRRDDRWEIWLTLTFALAGDFVAVMILANLDKIGK
jgi:hypothetical protein